jgi:hypothetical protein
MVASHLFRCSVSETVSLKLSRNLLDVQASVSFGRSLYGYKEVWIVYMEAENISTH